MINEKSNTKIPPIPDGVRKIQVTFFNNKTNRSHIIESLDLLITLPSTFITVSN